MQRVGFQPKNIIKLFGWLQAPAMTEIDRMQIEPAAKHAVAAGDDDCPRPALSFLDLIEREVHRADDGDVDGVASLGPIDSQGGHAVRHGDRQ